MERIINLSPDTYLPHFIHTQERDWAETNCYVDIWIELLHSLGYDPRAALAYTLGIDFEGDQWTFFKYPLTDLREIYGLEVQEFAVWRPLTNHIEDQLKQKRPVLVELDSFYMPDTHGTAYQLAHVKSTVAINQIDLEKKELGYFHGQGYYHLEGSDFENIFRLNCEDPSVLPPYVEIVKTDPRFEGQGMQREIAINQLKKQLSWLPQINPFDRYSERLSKDLEWLTSEDLEVFHQYSFATLRQFGACFELSTQFISWLKEQGEDNLDVAFENLKSLSEQAKIYQFQLARAVSRKKPLDVSPIRQMSERWQKATDFLKARYL